eukprot:476954-Prorocentrum_minimum.AAC.2
MVRQPTEPVTCPSNPLARRNKLSEQTGRSGQAHLVVPRRRGVSVHPPVRALLCGGEVPVIPLRLSCAIIALDELHRCGAVAGDGHDQQAVGGAHAGPVAALCGSPCPSGGVKGSSSNTKEATTTPA